MGGVTALDDEHVWAMVSKWALGSKIAIFTLDPSAKEVCYIINEMLVIGIMRACGGLILPTSNQVGVPI
jgi:hypothetical protein